LIAYLPPPSSRQLSIGFQNSWWKNIRMSLPYLKDVLHLSHPRLKVIFKAASQPCLPTVMNGGGHGGIQMLAPSATNVCMISSGRM
jgi:hypothetical protein